MKLPYGGFQANSPNDDPWVRLVTIAEYLEDGEALPPYLAQWLGQAIRRSNSDEKKLLENLGLKRKRGRQTRNASAWLVWGGRVCELEDDGLSPEAAVTKALEESTDSSGCQFSRTSMQEFRDRYKAADTQVD